MPWARRASPLPLALLAALSAPLAAAEEPGIDNPGEPAPVDLFFHLMGFQEFPVNTQAPPESESGDVGPGPLGTSSTCLPGTGLTGQALHTYRGYSSPSYVEYDFVEDGVYRIHPERGLSYDVRMAESPVLHWFVSTDPGLPGAGGSDPSTLPLVLPNVIVEAWLRTGEDLGGLSNDTGTLLGNGRSHPATLAGPLTPDVSPGIGYAEVEGRPVYHFQVPLLMATPTIPAAGGFTLRVDVRMDVPECTRPDGYVTPYAIHAHTSPAHRPRLSAQVHEAVRIEYLHPQRVGDQVFIHTALNSPFGNYDVREEALRLRIEGPTPAPSLRPGDLVQRTHEHGHHTEAVDMPWIWDYRADDAQGTYDIILEATNDQGTATARAVGRIEVGEEVKVVGCGSAKDADTGCKEETQDIAGAPVTQEASGAWLAVAVALLGGAAVRRRR